MPFITADERKDSYEVIVIGSGAAGGQCAYALSMEGVKVLMLEAGRNYDPVRETPMFQTPDMAPLHGADTPDKQHGFYNATVDGGDSIPGEPYSNASDDPKLQMRWWRARMLGGRTNHWGRNCYRHGPLDFKLRSRNGVGFDWPISYEDLAPWYDRIEMMIGVYGTNDGIENSPHSPDGVLLPPPAMRIGELFARKRGRQLGIPVIPAHRAVLSRPLDDRVIPARVHPGNPAAQRLLAASMKGRAPCFWATACGRGCSTGANYQSGTVHLAPALASGNLDIIPHAMAREVTLDRAGRADAVLFIDKATGKEHRAAGRAVIVAASPMESVRLLLNSKSSRFPNGLGNSSGRLGRAILDNINSHGEGYIPSLEGVAPHNEDGAGAPHAYVPWWLNREQREGRLDFTGGYLISLQTGRYMPSLSTVSGFRALAKGSYGTALKDDARRYYGATVSFSGQGMKVADDRSYCEIDPNLKDRWGIPSLRFHWRWDENEYRMVAHMQKTFADWVDAMGGRLTFKPDSTGRMAGTAPGAGTHEIGGAAMGSDPSNSVTNSWCQVWDAKNVLVTDGAVFCTNAAKNPTLTIMALAWRASDHLLSEMRRGNL